MEGVSLSEWLSMVDINSTRRVEPTCDCWFLRLFPRVGLQANNQDQEERQRYPEKATKNGKVRLSAERTMATGILSGHGIVVKVMLALLRNATGIVF